MWAAGGAKDCTSLWRSSIRLSPRTRTLQLHRCLTLHTLISTSSSTDSPAQSEQSRRESRSKRFMKLTLSMCLPISPARGKDYLFKYASRKTIINWFWLRFKLKKNPDSPRSSWWSPSTKLKNSHLSSKEKASSICYWIKCKKKTRISLFPRLAC